MVMSGMCVSRKWYFICILKARSGRGNPPKELGRHNLITKAQRFHKLDQGFQIKPACPMQHIKTCMHNAARRAVGATDQPPVKE
jgi:hypothetical protein